MKTVEYFCWIRAVERHVSASGLGDADTVAIPVDTSPQKSPLDEAAIAEMRITCPQVQWRAIIDRHPPPSGPRMRGTTEAIELFETRTRMILNAGQMTTVHLEQPVAPLDLDIDMRPIFGSRDDATSWIESPAGQRFSADAKALSLICFMAAGEC